MSVKLWTWNSLTLTLSKPKHMFASWLIVFLHILPYHVPNHPRKCSKTQDTSVREATVKAMKIYIFSKMCSRMRQVSHYTPKLMHNSQNPVSHETKVPCPPKIRPGSERIHFFLSITKYSHSRNRWRRTAPNPVLFPCWNHDLTLNAD